MLFLALLPALPCSFCQESPCSSNARSAARFASSAVRQKTPLLTAQGRASAFASYQIMLFFMAILAL
jgi:hypothetical protein